MAWNAGRIVLVAGAALAAAGWLALRGAGGRSASSPASAPGASGPVRGGLLVVAISSTPATLLESFGPTEDEQQLGGLVLPTLMNVELRGELVHVPALAEAWDWSPDGRAITFRLREAAWDDGRPVRARDVVSSCALVRHPEYPSHERDSFERIDSVDAIDERTVRFTFSRPYYRESQLADANVSVLPEHVYGSIPKEDVRGTPAALRPVGHGKFRVVDADPQEGWTLERNERVATDPPPWVRRVRVRPIADPQARLNALRQGQIDAMDGVPAEELDRVRAEGFRVLPRKERMVEYVIWNERHPALADRDVRRALTQAIDRRGMLASVFRGAGAAREPIGATTPQLADAYAADVVPLPHDVAAAERLLDARGWARSPAGPRAKDGAELRLRLAVNSETPRRRQMATMIQQDLAAVGIAVDVEPMSFPALRETVEGGRFDAAIYGVNAPLMLIQGDLWRTDAPFNFGGYRSAAVDAIVDRLRDLTDRAGMCEGLKELQRLVYEDQPVTFLCWVDRFVAVAPHVEGFHADTLSYLGYLERCWIPLERQRLYRGE